MAKATKEPTAAAPREPVHFRGIPSSLTGIVPEGLEAGSEIGLIVRGIGKEREPLDVGVQSDPDPRVLRVLLPADVPPGRYAGELIVDGASRPAQVEIEPSPHLRVFPEQLRLAGRGGETLSRSLSILNAGNVPITIRKVQAFGVIRAGGIERALRRAYVSTLAVAERRIDVIAESLAEAHGGLVKMSLTAGAGELKQGELRSLDVRVKLPPDLAPGTEYGGNWELAGLVYPVTIHVLGTPGEQDESSEDDVPGGATKPPVIG